MIAIDIHTHAFPDAIAERAIAKLQENCPWRAVGKGTVNSLLESMDSAGVKASAICTIATKPEQAEGILNWCRAIRSNRIKPLPSIHPDTPDAAGWLQRIADERFAGIKLHPMYQNVAADDKRLDAIYAAAEKLGLLIVAHSGRDIGFAIDDDRAAPWRFRNVIDRYQGLKLVCAHMGGWRDWDDALACLIGTDVHIETSFSLTELGTERAAIMMHAHGLDRVLFGTDWPWQSQQEGIEQVRSLGLSEPQTQQVLHSNAAALLS